MAEKRITTVDEVMTVDENADFVLISRGVQKDLKRLLVRRFPQGFDLHDDVTDPLTTLAGIDRLLVSDEGAPGAPQKYVTLATLRSFLLDLFDLHDDVPNELTSAADEDRLLISDESERGDPQRFITVQNLRSALAGMQYQKLTNEIELNQGHTTLNHSLGRVPIGFQVIFLCKIAEDGWSIGDEVMPDLWRAQTSVTTNEASMFAIHSATANSFIFYEKKRISGEAYQLPHKTTDDTPSITTNNWRIKLIVWG